MLSGQFKSSFKFFIKQRVIGAVRDVFLFLRHSPVPAADWENRILVINMNALGDIVIFTGVLQRYKTCFPGKKIYLLMRSDLGFTKELFGGMIDVLITVDHKNFGINPLYAARFINRLRAIGFRTVIDQGPSVTELIAKVISVRLGAKEVYGYEGMGGQLRNPYSFILCAAIRFSRKKIFPRYARLIQSIDKNRDPRERGRYPQLLSHLIAIYEGVGCAGREYETHVPVLPAAEQSVRSMLEREKIMPRSYCVLTLGASAPSRRWETEKFIVVARQLEPLKIPIVLIGSRGETFLGGHFEHAGIANVHNLIGKLSVAELIALIDRSLFVFTNETAPVHIAIARKVPMLCVSGAGHIGSPSLYGYKNINVWVYDAHAPCLNDFGKCELGIPAGVSAPCLATVAPEMAIDELRKLVDVIRDEHGLRRLNLAGDFAVEF